MTLHTKASVFKAVCTTILLGASLQAQAVTMDISLTQPTIKASPYHKPYVAVWLETPERQGVTTIMLWYQTHDEGQKSDKGKKWLKDLRQWWRKLGRDDSKAGLVDGYSGATRLPKTYQLTWDGKDATGKPVPLGEYWINVEAAREDGGRSFVRETINLSQAGKVTLKADQEIGPVTVRWD